MTNRLEVLSENQIRSMGNLAILAHDDDLYLECVEELSNIRARNAYKKGAVDGGVAAIKIYKDELKKIFDEELEKATEKSYQLARKDSWDLAVQRHTGESAEQVVNAKRDRDKYWTDRLREIKMLVCTNPTDAYERISDLLEEQN